VSANHKRWKSNIYYKQKQHNLGSFDTKQEAALAYDRASRQCSGDTPLNYESIEEAEEAAVQAQAGHTLVHDMCAGQKQPKPRPASGYYGVSADKKRWKARMSYDGKEHHLGTFNTKQEAALAHDRKARQCSGDTILNYESSKAAEEAAVQAQAEYTLTHLQQQKPRPTSGFYGVYANGKRWVAKIIYDKKIHNLGSFGTKQEAAFAYDKAGRQCGEKKPLNYDSIEAAEEAAATSGDQKKHTRIV
jgi:hypothetical protein